MFVLFQFSVSVVKVDVEEFVNGMFLIHSNGVGIDDNEARTGNAMILDPYGEILVETGKAADDMVVADLNANLLDMCTGRRWITSRHPELYGSLAVPTGKEKDTRTVRLGRNRTPLN